MVDHLRSRRLGAYEILSQLGAGGMGEVYRAKDLKLGREVAIKVLPERFTADPNRLARFRREARVLAALNHPRIAAIYGFEDAGGSSFLVLELVKGETLSRRIARGPLTIRESVAIALQIGEAVEAAHAKGIVHRDLKPSNVILQSGVGSESARSGDSAARLPDTIAVKVLDFGLAKASTALSESPTVTADHTGLAVIMGTPPYMSPEQARGEAIDSRTDIWSLGVVLYEMVAARLPFAGGETHAVLHSIIYHPHESLTALRTDVPTELDRIVGKSLSKNPGERYQHVDDLLVDLRTLEKQLDLRAPTAATPLLIPEPRGSRRKLITGVIGVLALLLVAATAAWLSWPDAAEQQRAVRRFSMKLGNVRPVISPDGRHIAFRRDGSLWIRDLESETPREIPGGKAPGDYYSDSGFYLAWSPDSQDLVFPAENELRRVSIVQGSSAKTICTLPSRRTTGRNVAGLAWSGDGRTIVFSRYDAGVYEVPAAGGSPTLLWEEPHADDVIPVDTPQGRAVIYATLAAAASGTPVHDLMVRMPDGQKRKIAALDTSWPELVYSPSGHILYRRGAPEKPSIWALPLSKKTLAVEGEPFLVERTGLGMSVAAEGTLVYLDFGPDRGQFLAWRDRSGRVLSEAKEGHDTIQILSLSPDGNRAVSNAVDGGRQSLWVYDVVRFVKTRLDLGSEVEGKRLLGSYWLGDNHVYYTLRTPPAAYQLRAVPVDGFGARRTLSFPEGLKVATDRTRDGRYLVVSYEAPTRPTGIWLLRQTTPDGPGEAIDFSRNSQAELYGVLSPNERYLAYTSDISGRVEVHVRPFPEGAGRWQISSNGGGAPVWGPEGNELFFDSQNELMRARVSTAGRFSVSLPAESLFRHAPLRAVEAPAPRYAVSPDGKRFLTVEHKYELQEPVVRVVEDWLKEFRRRSPQPTRH